MKFLYIKSCGAFMYSYLNEKDFTFHIQEADAIFIKDPIKRSIEENNSFLERFKKERLIRNHITKRLVGKNPEDDDITGEEYKIALKNIDEKIILLEEYKIESLILLSKKGVKGLWAFTSQDPKPTKVTKIKKFENINYYDLKIYKYAKKKLMKEINSFSLIDKIKVKVLKLIEKARWLPRIVYKVSKKRGEMIHGISMSLPHFIVTIPFMFFTNQYFLVLLYGFFLSDIIDHVIFQENKYRIGHKLLFAISLVTIPFSPLLSAVGFIHLALDWYGF